MHPTVQSKLSAIAIDDFSLKISKLFLLHFTLFLLLLRFVVQTKKSKCEKLGISRIKQTILASFSVLMFNKFLFVSSMEKPIQFNYQFQFKKTIKLRFSHVISNGMFCVRKFKWKNFSTDKIHRKIIILKNLHN